MGFISGLFVMLAPSFIPPFAQLTEKISSLTESISPLFEYTALNMLTTLLLVVIPVYLILFLILLKKQTGNMQRFFFSFTGLFFSGVVFAYLITLLLIVYATSQWRGPSL